MNHLPLNKLSQLHPRVASTLLTTSLDICQVSIHCHSDLGTPINSPKDFACALGYDLERVTKTLLVRPSGLKRGRQEELTRQTPYALAVLSANRRFSMKALAQTLGVKRVEIAKETELAEILGYPPTGVSPLGSKDLPVIMDADLTDWSTILVGGGAIGVEVELPPNLLLDLTNCNILGLSE